MHQIIQHIYTLVLIIALHISSNHASSETELIKHLQDKSSPFARPVSNPKDPINVTFGFELIHIVAVTESTQTIEMKLWIRMQWVNEFLKWDPQSFGNVTSTRLSMSDIWTPDLYLMEDIDQSISTGPEKYRTQIILMSDGTNYWNIPSLIHSSCLLDVTSFPFDRQHCTLKFVSWSYDQKELDIKKSTKDIVTGNYVVSPAWDLHDASAKIVSQKYACCPNPYVHIEYSIVLHREPDYYFYNIVLPCIIQMMIILFTFFLPPDSGERVGVAITVLLVFAVYLEVLNSNLPKTSTSSPALSRFYLSAMTGRAFSIMATCFVLVIHFKGAEKGVGPMPKWVKNILLDTVGVYMFVRKNLRVHKDEELLALEKHESFNHLDDLKGTDNHICESNTDYKVLNQSFSVTSEANMEKLVEEVQVITALINDQNLQDEIEEEWQSLAKVFDRIFFIMFLLFFVISSLVILLPVYQEHILDE